MISVQRELGVPVKFVGLGEAPIIFCSVCAGRFRRFPSCLNRQKILRYAAVFTAPAPVVGSRMA